MWGLPTQNPANRKGTDRAVSRPPNANPPSTTAQPPGFFHSSENPTCRQSPARLETRPRPAKGRDVRVSHASVAQWQSNGFVNRRSSVQSRPLAPVFLSRRWINPMPAIPDRNLTVHLGQDDRIHRTVPNRRPAGILPILFIPSKTPAFQPVPSLPHQSKPVPMPCFTSDGDLRIPFDSPERFHRWKVDQSILQTRIAVATWTSQSAPVPIKGTIMGRPEVAEGGLPLPETD